MLLTWLFTTVCHAQDIREKFGNWVVLNEQIPIVRTYALDFKTYLEFVCDPEFQPKSKLLVRTVWDTDELYYSGSFHFTHQFDSNSSKILPWTVYADVGHIVLRDSAAAEFVQNAEKSYILVIRGSLEELGEATFVLDGTQQAVKYVLDQCRTDTSG